MNYYSDYGRCPCQSNRKSTTLPTGRVLAMCYVPTQSWQNLYDPAKALCVGTIFEEMNKPFLGGKCR